MFLYSDYTDEQLFQLLQNGDESAFAEIYNRYWKLLFYVAFKRLNDFTEAEETVQEIFTDVWARRKSIVLRKSLKYYLAAAVKYQVIHQFAKRYRQLQHPSSRLAIADAADQTS